MAINDHVKHATRIINMTGEVQYVYDNSSGAIRKLCLGQKDISKEPPPKWELPTVFYAMTAYGAEKIRQTGRPCNDIAVFRYKKCGRHNVEISYFTWAEDPYTEIRLYDPNTR